MNQVVTQLVNFQENIHQLNLPEIMDIIKELQVQPRTIELLALISGDEQQ